MWFVFALLSARSLSYGGNDYSRTVTDVYRGSGGDFLIHKSKGYTMHDIWNPWHGCADCEKPHN